MRTLQQDEDNYQPSNIGSLPPNCYNPCGGACDNPEHKENAMIPQTSILTVAVAMFNRDRRAGAYSKGKKFYNLPASEQEKYKREALDYLPSIRSHEQARWSYKDSFVETPAA